ncbi:hypothetical protein [Flavobacterium sp.]|uniref:hypothetical protein n=1 Tax=Flavobacterium sp. TaxID=239 RepID=UPI00286CA3E8|nr:hypothetical protein [Flavobacterium sp.]
METTDQKQLLKQRILALETRQAFELNELKQQINRLSPLNYIKSTLHDITSSPDIKADLWNGVVGITTGYLLPKIGLLGLVQKPLRSLLGWVTKKLF